MIYLKNPINYAQFSLPLEYSSIPHLHEGCVKSVEYVCTVWNSVHTGDFVYIKEVDYEYPTIILSGTSCKNIQELLKICSYMTAMGVLVVFDDNFYRDVAENMTEKAFK